MRFQLSLFLLLFSFTAFAESDKAMAELFQKLDRLAEEEKPELVEEVFSKRFIRERGGKEAYIALMKSSPKEKPRPKAKPEKVKWRKGSKSEIFFVKNKDRPTSEFIVIKEDGKLKIDGQISDAE